LLETLILVVRETTLRPIYLRNILRLAGISVRILPASPFFYCKPRTMGDLVKHISGKTLDALCIKHNLYRRW
jgi:4-hydroxy-3-polyprenylbenzoate decarboxylase